MIKVPASKGKIEDYGSQDAFLQEMQNYGLFGKQAFSGAPLLKCSCLRRCSCKQAFSGAPALLRTTPQAFVNHRHSWRPAEVLLLEALQLQARARRRMHARTWCSGPTAGSATVRALPRCSWAYMFRRWRCTQHASAQCVFMFQRHPSWPCNALHSLLSTTRCRLLLCNSTGSRQCTPCHSITFPHAAVHAGSHVKRTSAGSSRSEGGFAEGRYAAASVLDYSIEKDSKGRKYYEYDVLVRRRGSLHTFCRFLCF